jgi:hypothetical protein
MWRIEEAKGPAWAVAPLEKNLFLSDRTFLFRNVERCSIWRIGILEGERGVKSARWNACHGPNVSRLNRRTVYVTAEARYTNMAKALFNNTTVVARRALRYALLTKYYSSSQIKKTKMGRARSTYGGV